MSVALNRRKTPTTKPTQANHPGRILAERPSAELVNTNIAAMRMAKNRITVLPKIGNWRAATGSIGPSANCTLLARTDIAAAPTKNKATNTMPLMSWRFDCRLLSRFVDAADHKRSATMNHRKAIPANGSRYRPTATGSTRSGDE